MNKSEKSKSGIKPLIIIVAVAVVIVCLAVIIINGLIKNDNRNKSNNQSMGIVTLDRLDVNVLPDNTIIESNNSDTVHLVGNDGISYITQSYNNGTMRIVFNSQTTSELLTEKGFCVTDHSKRYIYYVDYVYEGGADFCVFDTLLRTKINLGKVEGRPSTFKSIDISADGEIACYTNIDTLYIFKGNELADTITINDTEFVVGAAASEIFIRNDSGVYSYKIADKSKEQICTNGVKRVWINIYGTELMIYTAGSTLVFYSEETGIVECGSVISSPSIESLENCTSFSNIAFITIDNSRLYYISEKHRVKEVPCSEPQIYFMSDDNHIIYFEQGNLYSYEMAEPFLSYKEDKGLRKAVRFFYDFELDKLDKEYRKQLTDSDYEIIDVCISYDKSEIYYTNSENELWKTDSQGECVQIANDVTYMQPSINNVLYFIVAASKKEAGVLYKYTDGKSQQISEDAVILSLSNQNNRVYYEDTSKSTGKYNAQGVLEGVTYYFEDRTSSFTPVITTGKTDLSKFESQEVDAETTAPENKPSDIERYKEKANKQAEQLAGWYNTNIRPDTVTKFEYYDIGNKGDVAIYDISGTGDCIISFVLEDNLDSYMRSTHNYIYGVVNDEIVELADYVSMARAVDNVTFATYYNNGKIYLKDNTATINGGGLCYITLDDGELKTEYEDYVFDQRCSVNGIGVNADDYDEFIQTIDNVLFSEPALTKTEGDIPVYLPDYKVVSQYPIVYELRARTPEPQKYEVSGKEVYISWSSIPGVSGYKIYRDDNGTKTEVCTTTETEIRLEMPDEKTLFYITAYSDDPNISESEYSIATTTPQIIEYNVLEDSIYISWHKVAIADGYTIYQEQFGEKTAITTTSNTEITLDLPDVKTTYYIRCDFNLPGMGLTDHSEPITVTGKNEKNLADFSAEELLNVTYKEFVDFCGDDINQDWQMEPMFRPTLLPGFEFVGECVTYKGEVNDGTPVGVYVDRGSKINQTMIFDSTSLIKLIEMYGVDNYEIRPFFSEDSWRFKGCDLIVYGDNGISYIFSYLADEAQISIVYEDYMDEELYDQAVFEYFDGITNMSQIEKMFGEPTGLKVYKTG